MSFNWREATDSEKLAEIIRRRENHESWKEVWKALQPTGATMDGILSYKVSMPKRLHRLPQRCRKGALTLRIRIFELLDEVGEIPRQEIADAIGCCKNTASYYKHLWLKAQEERVCEVDRCECGLEVGFERVECNLCALQREGRVVLYRDLEQEHLGQFGELK